VFSQTQGEIIERRLRLVRALKEERTIHVHGDTDRLESLSREETLPPNAAFSNPHFIGRNAYTVGNNADERQGQMPRLPLHALIWSRECGYYEFLTRGRLEQRFRLADEAAWQAWLDDVSCFAFHGVCGRLNVYKETRRRAGQYWYAYHTTRQGTHKRYLGRTTQVTLTRLEQEAGRLNSLLSSAPGQEGPSAPLLEQRLSLLASKLAPPRLPSWLVPRTRLLDELNEACSHPLTLVSASAGSGKTTLLSIWVRATMKSQVNGERAECKGAKPALAWLSLDELDNDPIRFWVGVIAALRRCWPQIGESALTMLLSPEAPAFSTILVALLNELLTVGKELILVLDDYHVISDQAIGDSMLALLDHLPENLHLVLATRADPDLPLSRLRARSQLIEIRDPDLRFNQEEATSFLVEGMGLPLSEEDVATLQKRTEGWIAGLQLAALSLRKQQDREAWVKDFAGSHHLVLDYIQQDILARLPVALEDFLLATSILTRMNARLCQAVTCAPDESACQQMLEEAERANLFVIPLDSQRQWYRYHDLFREALLARLHTAQPRLVPVLHQRAARFYEATGQCREAITHALAVPDYPSAASLIEKTAELFWMSSEARTVHDWVLCLPDSILRAHLHLATNAALRFLNSVNLSTEAVRSSMAAQVGQTITRVEEILRRKAELALSDVEVALIERRLHLLQALIEARSIRKLGNTERLVQLAEVLEAFPADAEISWNLIPLSLTYWLAVVLQGEGSCIRSRLLEARQLALQAGDILSTIRVITWLAHTSFQAGQLYQARIECFQGLDLIEQIGGRTAMAGYLYGTLFDIFYAWNRLEEAADALQRMLRIAQDWQQVEMLVRGTQAQVRLALARGDLLAAQKGLQRMEALVEQEGYINHVAFVSTLRIRYWLAAANLDAAAAWADQTVLSPETWNPMHKWEALMLIQVLLARRQFLHAVEELERFRKVLDSPGDLPAALEWMALYTVALHSAGSRGQAARVAVRLLQLTEPEGFIRVYLDAGDPMHQVLGTLLSSPQGHEPGEASIVISRASVSRVLASFEQDGSSVSNTPLRTGIPLTGHQEYQLHQVEGQSFCIEPLSPQELKVLSLLADGQTYAQIAQTLIVSLNTIKTQVSSIYRKLGVSRRPQAIMVASRLRLL
jgi:LuxR family maltose regulon positive regulatory protein